LISKFCLSIAHAKGTIESSKLGTIKYAKSGDQDKVLLYRLQANEEYFGLKFNDTFLKISQF